MKGCKKALLRNSNMQKQNVIEVSNIEKAFKVFYDRGKSLKEMVITRGRRTYEKREVLKGITFQIKKGEAVGLIGKNGCGKSTLLKLLTKIIYPDKGYISVQGRVSSLLELGAGFHPDMSGRENIYLNAAVFGLSRKEIKKRIDEIIAFSELEQFIENPVRTYSSGMYMRLAFAVAINVEADVLLIDEILAVGDVSFQTKCFEKLKEIKASGTTIVIVSHSLGQIEQICDRTIWIENGKIIEQGIPKFIHEHYLAAMEENRLKKIEQEIKYDEHIESGNNELNSKWSSKAIRSGNREIELKEVRMQTVDGSDKMVFSTGDDIVIKMRYTSKRIGLKGNFGVGINRDDGVYCYGTNTIIELGEALSVKENGSVKVIIKNNTLLPAKYILDVAIHTPDEIPYDKIHHIMEFQIKSSKKDFGVCRLENIWIVDEIVQK